MTKGLRHTLKNTLLGITKWAIRKHRIKFVAVVGWYGTELIKEGVYELLSEKMIVRRNVRNIWWDFSVPLTILGYEDKKYSFIGWIVIISKSIFSLLLNKSNPHRIILNLNLSEPNTARYWGRIIKPELLIITSYKEGKNHLIERLIERTKNIQGKILVSDVVNAKMNTNYDSFSLEEGEKRLIVTPNNVYPVSENISGVMLKVYPALFATAEAYRWPREEIVKTITKYDIRDILSHRILHSIKAE